MTQTQDKEPTIRDVLTRLDKLATDVEKSNEKFEVYRQANQSTIQDVVTRLDKLSSDVEHLSTDVEKSNDKFEIYRQANQSLVNLAFGLIASATVAIVISVIFRR
jgi:septation ring formation regulator EzrA